MYALIEIEIRGQKAGSKELHSGGHSSERKDTSETTTSAMKGPELSSDATRQGDDGSFVISGHEAGIRVSYPRLSRTLGEEGKVVVALQRSEELITPVLDASSGYERLDQAALLAVKSALQEGRVPQEILAHHKVKMSFIFRLARSSD